MSKQDLLEQVKQKIIDDLVCPLKDAATNMVFGKGNPDADVLFIGEAPGREEDLQGIPFVGRAGKELDKQLRTIGLSLEQVYIANILKYRPPQNRDPTNEEIRNHTPYLVEQITIIKPKVIVTLGNYATKFVLAHFDPAKMKTVTGITALHGRAQDLTVDGFSCKVVPIYHPAAMLYNPRIRESFEADFAVIAKILHLKAPSQSHYKTLDTF